MATNAHTTKLAMIYLKESHPVCFTRFCKQWANRIGFPALLQTYCFDKYPKGMPWMDSRKDFAQVDWQLMADTLNPKYTRS